MSHFYLNLLRLVAFLPVVVIEAKLQQTTDICKLIESRLPGRIVYPDTSVYRQSLSSYYTGQERDLEPGCIFRPTKTAEVSRFVKLITGNGKYGPPTPQFAIRGGGHSLFSGAANIDGGVTVDMRSMKSVMLNQDRTVASVGGGAIFSDVYPQLVPYNLTVMGGRVPGIAVGGFTTGGKYSCFSIVVVQCSFRPRWRRLPITETWLELRQYLRLRGSSCQRQDCLCYRELAP